MTYNVKTAIRIETERDRQELIPFLESLGGVNEYLLNEDHTRIGDIWYISTDKNKILINVTIDLQSLDYTILNGVPEGWREELDTEYKPKSIDQLIDQICQSGDMIDEFHTRDIQGLINKIEQLESEKEELEECLELCVTELESSYRKLGYSSSNILTQAKQLLNK